MRNLFTIAYTPLPSERPFLDRAETQADAAAEVTVSALAPTDSRRVLGVPAAHRGIQPVWIRVRNRSETALRLNLLKIDPNYFTPLEAAALCHFSILKRIGAFGLLAWFFLPWIILLLPAKLISAHRANIRMSECFRSLAFPLRSIEPGQSSEGFVYTPADVGTKAVSVRLLAGTETHDYAFSLAVPGLDADYHRSPRVVAEPHEFIDCEVPALTVKLREQPRATTNARGSREGDPVNLVIVGDFHRVIGAFAARWDETETITLASCWRTARSFLVGSEYRYSPVSPLYLYGRPQDFALQRIRGTLNERLHLRLWWTPLRLDGQTVWVGQVSRDIGVRFTRHTWNLTTHRVDPDVDEARDYVMQDLFEAERIVGAGYVDGVGACTRGSPRRNLTGDPYFTDGKRAVIVVSDVRTTPRVLRWS